MDNKISMALAVLLVALGACRPSQNESTEGEQQEPLAEPGAPSATEPAAEPGMQREPTGDGMEGERAQPGDGQEGKRAQGEAAGATLEVADIAEKPGMHVGERINVSGEVDEVMGDHALTIKGGGKELLVLGRKQASWMANRDMADKRVLVTGTLQPMSTPSEFEQNLGWTFDSKLQDALKEQKAVLIATSVQPIEGESKTMKKKATTEPTTR